jgi:hypothetical protein
MAVTIASQLQIDLIMSSAMRAFRRRVLPVALFSTVFRNVQLRGTDIVDVPYYPLATAASLDFSYTTGYQSGDATLSYKQVTVNKRKYQPLELTSKDLSRQPALDPETFGAIIGEKLAEDVVADILSVVTLANFGAAIFNGPANSFDSDDIVDIRTACNVAMWPRSPAFRGLALDSAYDGSVVKDLKNYSSSGDDTIWRDGELQEVLGFRYAESPLIPTNGEGLIGFAVNPSAILVAFSPITPAPAVRAVMTDYRTYSDQSGLTLEYREYGNAQSDKEMHIIECNYGYALGEAAALKRITNV